jgi:hypothetical protein
MFTAFVNYAQQDAQFTQYMYNTININPAMPDQDFSLAYIVHNG